MNVKLMAEVIEKLESRITVLEENIANLQSKKGPSSTREMTQDDAEKIINGEYKSLSHKAAAEKLGLSYGQIYSARGGYTFKNIEKKR